MQNAADLMPPVLRTVRPETSLAECARLFREHDIRHLPVVTADGEPRGVVTEEEVYRFGALTGDPGVWVSWVADEPRAGDVAAPVGVTFSPEEELVDVVLRLLGSPDDVALALGRDGLCGLVTEHDLVWLAQWRLSEALPVGAIASRPVLAVQRDAPAMVAWSRMKVHGVRHVCVLDGQRLVGVLSARDLLAADVPRGRALTAGELVWRSPLEIDASSPACEAATRMVADKVGCLPVVDAEGRPVAVLTRSDLLRALGGQLQATTPVPVELRASA